MDSKIETSQRATRFLNSRFYKKDFEPFVKKQIERYKSIKEIKKENLEESFYKNMGMVEAYQSVLNKIQEWTQIKVVDEGGEKDGSGK